MLVFFGVIVCLLSIEVGAAEDVTITFEGHFGGITDAVVVSGNYAYISQEQDFVVLDISNPEAPSELGRLDTDGFINDINVSGSYAYVADDYNGLVIIDISNPAAPTSVGSYNTAGNAQSVAVSGSYAYVADDYNGLVIIDISNPAAPTLAGSYYTAGCVFDIAVSGNYAYVADSSNGLLIIDISNPAAPTPTGSCNTAGYANEVAVSDSYAYIADYYGLVIIDISNPAAPTLAGSYDTGYALGVAVSGSYAYVADGSSGLLIINISNPAAPTLAGRYDTPGDLPGDWRGVAVLGSYVYVADYSNGLVILRTDVTLPPSILVGQGAPDPAVEQLFIEAYDRNGGVDVLGDPATEVHDAWGYWVQDFPGANGYAGGIIMYNPNENSAYYIHGKIWDRYYSLGGPIAQTDIEFQLGLPISDVLPYVHSELPLISSHGSQYRYQNFAGETEMAALEYNLATDMVYEIHGAIYATWSAMGYANSILGLVTSDERDAAPSFKGTTGRVSDFENGHLHWHSSGDHYMVTYMTYDDLDKLYVSMGGTASWLGFPVMDQEDRGGYGYCEFEGGYIEWDAASGTYKAKTFGIIDGLVAEWHFDDGTGNILRDSSGNGNDGTIYGATWTTNGKFGTALQFDGNDYIVIPDSPELSGGTGKNMTVEFWFNTNKQGGYIISKIRDVSYKDWSALIGGFGPGMNFWYENNGYDRRFYSGSIIEEGVWHHGAFTFQRSTYGNNAVLKMYLDGNELPLTPFYQDGVPSNQLYDMPDTSAPVNIGYSGSYYNCCFFNGKIDEIKIFDRVLSNNEIKAEYERGGSAPTITITYPNGGEDWQVGTTQTIQWSYTGDTGPGVEIEIFNSSGPVQTFTYVPIGSAGSGSYLWTIPGNLADGTDYQVRITIIGSAYSDTSGYFTISAPSHIPQDKSLLQVEGQHEVYWLQNDRLYWVTEQDVVSQMSGIPGWDSVNTLAASEFDPAAYEQGPRFITTEAESDGLLIREVGDYKVYLVENGKKRHFTYPDVMVLNGYSFDNVIEVSSEISNIFQVGDPFGIEVDLYFNKAGSSGEFSQFMSGDIVISIIETTVAEDHTVETYVKRIKPDGTIQYAYYENVDFQITDPLQFSDTERPLYPGKWHAQTKTWNWDEYVFTGNEMEGVYTLEFWYQDVASGKILGKDVQGYEFSNIPSDPEDTNPPFIRINLKDETTKFNKFTLIQGEVLDPSGIETLTISVNGNEKFNAHIGIIYPRSYPIFYVINLKEGLNKITITTRDNSDNHNEITKEIIVNYYPFNVEINSPNDLDRYTSDDSISFTGEVGGGTSPFTFKWIINDVEYPEPSDNREYTLNKQLSSGEYTVKLEVEDSNGHLIKTRGIRIDVSPFNVDSGFIPNRNGYQFHNIIKESLSRDLFRNTYGVNLVDNSLNAQTFYDERYRIAAQGGSCFGMSASSLNIYQNNLQSWDIAGPLVEGPFSNPGGGRSLNLGDFYTDLNFNGQWDSWEPMALDYNQNGICDGPPREWGIFPMFISTPIDWVEYYHGRWYYPAIIEDTEKHAGPINAYNSIKQRMVSGNWIHDPMVLSIWWYNEFWLDQNMNGHYDPGEPFTDTNNDNELTTAGHTVVPYRIEETLDHQSARVFVYDSNLPGDRNLFIDFDLSRNLASANGYNNNYGDNFNSLIEGNRGVAATSLAAFQQRPNQIPNLDSVSASGNLLYTDTSGNQLGNLINEFKNEILGAYRVRKIPGQNSQINPSKIYFISDLNLKRELYGINDGIATVSISRPNSLVIADVQVSPNSVDEINVPTDGSSVEFISGEGTSTLSLMLDRENTEFARIVRITGSEIKSENGVQISFSDDLSKVRIINKGLPHGYDLYLEQIGSNPSSYNSLKPIIVEENSAVWITPLDWNDIDNNALLIEYDSGNDGTIELSEMINTYNITFLPPITTMDQFNLTDGSTLPIKFTASNRTSDEFIYDNTVNVTITNSTGHLITYFTNGTGMDSVRINSTEEQYIVNFHTKDYELNMGETYAITVTFGELDSLRGYDITYFTLMEGGKVKGKSN
ncbi:MAG: hypothetical protein C5S44_06505 [Candidatus Methanocomedens sp.]|nr:MAG: hypothetical protein C5S44_06505 [ANME-2 cluster archaeon]